MRKLSFLLLFLLLLCSCGKPEGGVWYDGRELTPDEIEALLTRESESEASVDPAKLLAFRDGEIVPTRESVFWTKSGSVFHLDPLCRHLTGAKEIYYGTAEDAATQNKERACTACEKEQ